MGTIVVANSTSGNALGISYRFEKYSRILSLKLLDFIHTCLRQTEDVGEKHVVGASSFPTAALHFCAERGLERWDPNAL